MAQIKWHEDQLAAEHRRQMHAAGNVLLNGFVKAALQAGRQLTQVERAHMHRHLGGLKVEKGRVQAGEGFHFGFVSVTETLTERGGLGHWGLQ